MLAELVEYLLTPCPQPARRLGYLTQAVALGARHRRVGRAWRTHLERAKAFIVETAAAADPAGTALVVGSGALLDIPFRQLCDRFSRVVLADMAHPWPARWAVARAGNARLAYADCTGCLHEVLAGRLPAPETPTLFTDLAPAFTVSANLLSQLPLLPVARLKRTGKYAPQTLAAFAGALRRHHLAWLRRLPGVRCLVTDLQSRLGDDVVDLLDGLDLPGPAASWTWRFAPRPEVSRQADEVRLVAGFVL